MNTFSIQTLGCKVNQYESEQIATLLRSRGLRQVDPRELADLRVVNTCSVTTEAAAKSRQTVGRTTRLRVLEPASNFAPLHSAIGNRQSAIRTVAMGCWATSNPGEAARLPGVDAVLTHADDLASKIDQLLQSWRPRPVGYEGTIIDPGIDPGIEAGTSACQQPANPRYAYPTVKRNPSGIVGTRSLPLVGEHQTGRQRAFLKVQDGCDAHCTYCIIPQLRPVLWSKPIDDLVDEATRLVASGHLEIVLTGIFLGAYGQPTALRRRQPHSRAGDSSPLANAVEALCMRAHGMRRLRLSSLEPGEVDGALVQTLSRFPQVVPHFHLPLQSGSDRILRKMNRQYGRDDYLRMIDDVHSAFDRPAITTDIITGFPGETDEDFERTLEVVDHAGFIHIHAFPFSPRPGTAAGRWSDQFVSSQVSKQRIEQLTARAAACGFAFRSQFLGDKVEILVEQADDPAMQHGRCERYFDVHFKHDQLLTGRAVRVRIDRITPTRTHGTVIFIEENGR